MSVMSSNAEKFLWNNLRMYLLTHKSCLLDNILIIKDPDSDIPLQRYGSNYIQELDQHLGLGSYVNTQATQFSRLPFITVNFMPLSGDNCNTRVVIGFDIAFTTDTPTDDTQIPTGNSNESVAAFRANIMNALDELMYDATDTVHYGQIAFYDALRGQVITNPIDTTKTKQWTFDVWGQIDDKVDVSELSQLKREDRSSGISVFSVVYTMDLNRLKGKNLDCGC